MATTSNYGWTTPDDTSLVKDGASAIRSLGTAIDTSLNTALGTKKAGLVLLNTTSFSGVSSQSVNDVFSTTYRNYRIFVTVDSANQQTNLTLRLRVSGSDNSNSSYRTGNLTLNTQSGQTLTTVAANNGTSIKIARLENIAGSQIYDAALDIGLPFETTYTTFKGFSTSTVVSGQNYGEIQYTNGFFIEATSFTGFSILGATSMSGFVSVYGYNR